MADYIVRDQNIWTAIDLEMNQPSGKIIQIGAVKFHLLTGEVFARFDRYVKIDELLCTDSSICDIPALTGITDAKLANEGMSLLDAYTELAAFHRAPVQFDGVMTQGMINPIVWGGDDSRCLREQIEAAGYLYGADGWYCFGHRIFDMKSFHQWFMMAEGKTYAGGLSKSIHKWNVQFKFRAHNALNDAYNTAMLACAIYKKIRGITE
jgi:inhibitor of KinA sporulation pathway (predicted exonuclease)